jgi:hypothetical protein
MKLLGKSATIHQYNGGMRCGRFGSMEESNSPWVLAPALESIAADDPVPRTFLIRLEPRVAAPK